MSTRKKRGVQAYRDEVSQLIYGVELFVDVFVSQAASPSTSASLGTSEVSSGELVTRPMRGQKVRVGPTKPANPPAPHAVPLANPGAGAFVADLHGDLSLEVAAVAAEVADRAQVQPAPAPAPAPEGAALHNGIAFFPVNIPEEVLAGRPPRRGPLAAVGAFVRAILKGVLDIVKMTAWILKFPAIFFVTVYILLVLTGHVVDAATECLAPICAVFPGFPACRVTAAADVLTATFGNVGRKAHDYDRIDFPALMAVQSRTLDQLLAHSAAGSQLAVGVKHAELAVKDLSIVVRASNLTSKDILGRTLEEFAQQARGAARDLQQLSAKLYGAVDTYVFPCPIFCTPALTVIWQCSRF